MIDWARVNELREEIGAEDFGEVVDLFLEEGEEVIGRVERMRDDEIGGALHFLKGMALNLGFAELARLCQGGDAASDAEARRHVVATYRDSRRAFEAGMARMAA